MCICFRLYSLQKLLLIQFFFVSEIDNAQTRSYANWGIDETSPWRWLCLLFYKCPVDHISKCCLQKMVINHLEIEPVMFYYCTASAYNCRYSGALVLENYCERSAEGQGGRRALLYWRICRRVNNLCKFRPVLQNVRLNIISGRVFPYVVIEILFVGDTSKNRWKPLFGTRRQDYICLTQKKLFRQACFSIS